MKIALITSAAATFDANGAVPEYRAFLEYILKALRDNGGDVYSDLEQHNWQLSSEPSEISLRRNLDGLNETDVLLAIVAGAPTAEVEFMIGYAVAKEKRIVLAKHIDDEIAAINSGVIGNGQMTLLHFDSADTLASQLIIALNAPED